MDATTRWRGRKDLLVTVDGRTRRHLCVAVDAKGYSERGDFDQREVQRVIVEVCDDAALAAGLRRDAWHRQPTGDGENAVLPEGEPETVVVDQYVREIDASLARYNRRVKDEARIRLRVAVHFGRLLAGSLGHAGPALITVARLVDAAPLRDALTRAPEANLAMLVSSQVFDDTIATMATTMRPDDFRSVAVEVKEFTDEAWLWIPGRTSQPPSSKARARRSPEPRQINNFQGTVNAPNSVFGMTFGAGE